MESTDRKVHGLRVSRADIFGCSVRFCAVLRFSFSCFDFRSDQGTSAPLGPQARCGHVLSRSYSEKGRWITMYSGLTWLTRTLGIPECSTSLRRDFSDSASAFALAENSHLEPSSDSGATDSIRLQIPGPCQPWYYCSSQFAMKYC